jgi:hypothetical protein
MATPLGQMRNRWWALLFAYSLTGLSLATLNSGWVTHAARDLITGIMETATAAAPTERVHEKTRRHLTQRTQRMALVVDRLLHDDLTSEDIATRRRAAVALVLLAASERWK